MQKEEAKKKEEIARVQKELARKKEEMARMQRQAARREMDAAKRDFNLEKSRIALERLQLNWIKWNLTCIALGFTAYKFYYARVEKGDNLIGYYITGREIGIFLAFLGLITLLFATVQHRKNIAKLKLQYTSMHYSLSLRLSYVVLGFSVIVLLMIILRT